MVLGALAIMLGSAALGIAVNHFSPHRLPVVQKVEMAPPALPSWLTGITQTEAKARFDAKDTPFLDARSPEKYAAGHITGAHSLPVADFETRFLDLAEQLEQAPQVIVYCESADCGEAIELAERLKEAYQGKILVLLESWNGWERAGYPVTKGETP
jgi:rhodanese-related sulfurtransferase